VNVEKEIHEELIMKVYIINYIFLKSNYIIWTILFLFS